MEKYIKENCKNCLNKGTNLCEIRKCIDNIYKCANKDVLEEIDPKKILKEANPCI